MISLLVGISLTKSSQTFILSCEEVSQMPQSQAMLETSLPLLLKLPEEDTFEVQVIFLFC